MRFSSALALTGAALAAASPLVTKNPLEGNNFNVTNFIFGCTAGCFWYFDVSIDGSEANHPAIDTPVHCEGNLDDNKTYKPCGNVSETQHISAYIVKDTNELKLQYEVFNYYTAATYWYLGNTTVYAATGDNAALQKPNFRVNETSAYAVA
ncbi:Hypothetical predicted protein [Lecanosticta acicola]|uniref:Uncharacterized protein n=1 Tax=Lecanosticta acicola TaxID=111012 RepID=A0AAI8YSH6_9PEZI|nr:Hypothetical predicted protein [Lecanosticta acicola]